jgi:CheY-like chemotaxis protein
VGPLRQYRVLVAEDDEAFLQTLSGVLVDDGRFEVVGLARNGREAVALAKRLEPDAVVMDIEMPVFDGVEATRRLAELSPGLPIIEIRDAGAADYVRKSRVEDDLVAVLQALVADGR